MALKVSDTEGPGGVGAADVLNKIISSRRLTWRDFEDFISLIRKGEANRVQIGAFLAIAREEFIHIGPSTLRSIASVFLRNAVRFPKIEGLVDIVGTGGDSHSTFNVSTAAAIVNAGAGLKTAKHGSRSSRTKLGASDLLETLGSVVNVGPAKMLEALERSNFCFLSATHYHPLMRLLGIHRRSIGIRTVFNYIGPLISPARPDKMIVGVASEKMGDLIAPALVLLGVKRLWVVFGEIGLDEISIQGKTIVWEYSGGVEPKKIRGAEYLKDLVYKGIIIKKFRLSPDEFGLEGYPISAITSTSCDENVKLLKTLLYDPQNAPGAIYNSVVMTAAAALYLGLDLPSLREGCRRAIESIEEKKAASVLDSYIKITQYI